MGRTGTLALVGVAIAAAAVAWQAEGLAQGATGTGAGVVTIFDHTKLDASFAKALANGGTQPIWDRTSAYGKSEVSVHSRESTNSACPQQGCSHKIYTAVVIVTSGAATLEVGGIVKATGADKFGALRVEGGESHRISAGDIFIMPPDTMHWYRDVAGPFHYIEVPVP
jgi:hypothetical protein